MVSRQRCPPAETSEGRASCLSSLPSCRSACCRASLVWGSKGGWPQESFQARLAPLLPAAGRGGSCWNRCPDPAALGRNTQRWKRPMAQPWVAEFGKAGRNLVNGPLLSNHPGFLWVLLFSGQVKEAETRETHLKNELKKHQIELLHPNKVRLLSPTPQPSACTPDLTSGSSRCCWYRQ